MTLQECSAIHCSAFHFTNNIVQRNEQQCSTNKQRCSRKQAISFRKRHKIKRWFHSIYRFETNAFFVIILHLPCRISSLTLCKFLTCLVKFPHLICPITSSVLYYPLTCFTTFYTKHGSLTDIHQGKYIVNKFRKTILFHILWLHPLIIFHRRQVVCV